MESYAMFSQMRSVDIETTIIIMQYDNNPVYQKWIFYIASSPHKTFSILSRKSLKKHYAVPRNILGC